MFWTAKIFGFTMKKILTIHCDNIAFENAFRAVLLGRKISFGDSLQYKWQSGTLILSDGSTVQVDCVDGYSISLLATTPSIIDYVEFDYDDRRDDPEDRSCEFTVRVGCLNMEGLLDILVVQGIDLREDSFTGFWVKVTCH